MPSTLLPVLQAAVAELSALEHEHSALSGRMRVIEGSEEACRQACTLWHTGRPAQC